MSTHCSVLKTLTVWKRGIKQKNTLAGGFLKKTPLHTLPEVYAREPPFHNRILPVPNMFSHTPERPKSPESLTSTHQSESLTSTH